MTDRFDGMMEAAGFEGVTKERIRFPVSPWAKDEKLRELGVWTQTSLLSGLEGMSLALCTRLHDWSQAETMVFCAEVRKDLKNTDVHAYWNGYIIQGRKPLATEEERWFSDATGAAAAAALVLVFVWICIVFLELLNGNMCFCRIS